eukprot:TRINITY_DN12427_c0_g1_i1.p1 TRINITY_DN12427_c0_g1~~TRINITY_DN12427_c0_g1_i1.p1  ORF type:complete len:187 (+),score=22.26 TRINITY_DN12427_c0_g1_i1:71-562(+)
MWRPEMYEMWGGGGSPFRKGRNNTLLDRKGQTVRLLGITQQVIHDIKTEQNWVENGTHLAYCSTTDEPEWARECLQLFEAGPGLSLWKAVDHPEIYKGSKANHFRAIRERTKIPFEDMLFLDNEMGNIRTVQQLGVVCIYCPDGLTSAVWKQALSEFANRAPK